MPVVIKIFLNLVFSQKIFKSFTTGKNKKIARILHHTNVSRSGTSIAPSVSVRSLEEVGVGMRSQLTIIPSVCCQNIMQIFSVVSCYKNTIV